MFIFPDLNTGNNTYKAVQRSSGAVAIGPVLQGLKQGGQRPVPRRPGRGHRQHRGHHRHPGAGRDQHEREQRVSTPILLLNCGSSSIKYQVIDADSEDGGRQRHHRAHRRRVGHASTTSSTARPSHVDRGFPNHARALTLPGAGVRRRTAPTWPTIKAVGHRTVHGGERVPLHRRDRRRGAREAARAEPAGAAAQPAGHRRHRGRPRGAAGRAARRHLRHRVLRHAAAGGLHLRHRRRARQGARHPQVRLPRHLAQLRVDARSPRCSARTTPS